MWFSIIWLQLLYPMRKNSINVKPKWMDEWKYDDEEREPKEKAWENTHK